jgi:hypothetical protein
MREEILKAIGEVQRDTVLPGRFVFVQYARFERVGFNKLKLLAFIENSSRGALVRTITSQAIKDYEKENGNLVNLALKALKE